MAPQEQRNGAMRFAYCALPATGCNEQTKQRPRSTAMKKLVLETTAPFQGLPELVAYDEGLFEREGLAVEWADREQGVEKKVEADVTSPKGVNPFARAGKLL